MQIETVEELVEQLADWFGVYGGCKNPDDDRPQDKCTMDASKPFCCRAGFAMVMEERIRKAIHNEVMLRNMTSPQNITIEDVQLQNQELIQQNNKLILENESLRQRLS